ncbi:unnamed protein product [Lactuca saligna]|uniref:1-phosphatidylinositol-3-phosphate 5-kinase n=1 Tax=Lactuca saligna TaxID=75948 RepID=A0AA35YLM9_LACSI|nr:unnamed protein product [Lactuca saligna]
MTHRSLISLPTSALSPAVPVTKTDNSFSCSNDSVVEMPSNDRTLREESSTENHEPCNENGYIDSKIWFPPEPEDQEGDIKGNVANYDDGIMLGDERSGNLKEKIRDMMVFMKSGVKKHVEHLLISKGISCAGNDGDTWVDTIWALSLEAVVSLKLDTLYGKAVNPDIYVKVICVATGSRNQSKVFKGLVFKTQAADSHMPITKPQLLLVWDVSSDGLSSLESHASPSGKEEDVMEMIENFHPDVVLVEKILSQDIQKSIHAKGLPLVMEMKRHHLEKVAICTSSPMSSDQPNDHKLMECETFYLEKIEEEHAALFDNGKRPMKTIMFLGGNPARMGLTILLKGSHRDELKKIKRVVRHAVIIVYHVIRKGLFFQRAAAIDPTEKTILSNCNEDLMTHKGDITAVLGSRRISLFISRHNATSRTACLPDINFYQNFDMPFGKFLVDDLFNQKLFCGTCKELAEAHISYYAHQDRKVTVEVKRLPSHKHLPGENEGKLWMWNFCGQCKPSARSLNPTKRVLFPIDARGVSFGSILELAFLNHPKWEIRFSCGHYFYGDYLHFYGLGSMVVMLTYSTVPTFSVYLPPRKVKFSDVNGGDFLKEEVEKVLQQGRSMFVDIEKSLKEMENKFVGSTLNIEGSCKRFSDIKETLKQEQDQFEVDMRDVSMNKWSYKALSLNHIRWKLMLLSYIWNERVCSLHSSDLKLVDTQTSDGKFSLVHSLKSADPKGWMWRPFSEIQSISLEDLQRGHKRNTQEGLNLHFLLGTDNHMVSDYEDELSSIIACALALAYQEDQNNSLDVKSYQTLHPFSSLSSPNWFSFSYFMDSLGSLFCYPSDESFHSISDGLDMPDSSTYLHPVICMGRLANTPKYTVASLFPKEFLDLRKHCGLSEVSYISSLSRCKPWDAKGGKSECFFAKTLDDRFIIKQIHKTEFCTFHKTAFAYFAYIKKGHTTCLAKILGVYQVTNKKSGTKYDLMVMENITYCRKFTRLYDLKGALFKRSNPATDVVGNVYLDQNFVDDMKLSPIYVEIRSVRKLLAAILNDTSFLHWIGVMDYSLLLGVDTEKKELLCGIIDYLRPYDPERIVENWWKSNFKVPKNHLPTVIPPKEYMNRFVDFIKNFLGVLISERVQEIQKVHPMAQITL